MVHKCPILWWNTIGTISQTPQWQGHIVSSLSRRMITWRSIRLSPTWHRHFQAWFPISRWPRRHPSCLSIPSSQLSGSSRKTAGASWFLRLGPKTVTHTVEASKLFSRTSSSLTKSRPSLTILTRRVAWCTGSISPQSLKRTRVSSW